MANQYASLCQLCGDRLEQTWQVSQPVTPEDILRAEEKSQVRRSRRSLSLTRTRSASVNRELLPELNGD